MAGTLFTDDISDLEPRVFVEEVLGFARNNYNLRNLCQIEQMPKLQARVRKATKGTIDTKVGEGEEADITSSTYTYTDFSLWKNVGHVDVTDESQMRASFDVLNMEIKNAGRDLARAENDQIATEWDDNASSTAGNDWGAANNPLADISGVADTMEALDKGYDPQDIAMHPTVYTDLITNDDIETEALHQQIAQNGRFDRVGGMSITRDIHLTNTKAYVIDVEAPATILGQGGTSAERYRDPKAGKDAYMIRQYLQPKVVLDDAIYILTGVHT